MHYQSTVKNLTFLVAALILSSCSDSSLQEPASGGGAGDGSGDLGNPEAFALIQPFSGHYVLQNDWNGRLGDRAYLSIREPEISGVAEAILFDIDDVDNCVLPRVTGEVRKDDFSNNVFLNDIIDLNESELTLSGTTLTIELADEIDRDGDGDLRELVQVTAEPSGISEMDMGPSCF